MFVLVKYQDGIKKIVPSSDIKHFYPNHISYSKKYKVKWENEEYYDGVIIIVGDTETEVQQKASQKRQKITPFELCESADDTDSSITGKVQEKNNNNRPKDYIKQIVSRKIEKIQMNLDKFVKSGETGDARAKKTNGEPPSSDTTGNKSNESTKFIKASAVVPTKDVSSIKNIDSKTTAKVACKDVKKCSARPATSEKNNNRETLNKNEKSSENQKPINGKDRQESNIRASINKNVKSSENRKPINGKDAQESNIRASLNKNEKSSNQKKIDGKIGSKQSAPPTMAKNMDSKKPPISVTMTNHGCESCKKVEKKFQDEVSNLNYLNNQLKQALKDKDKMLTEATRLNMDLQSKLLDQFDELKLIVGDMKQRAQENLDKNQGVLPIGYRRLDKSMIHLGQDVWITIPQYDSISCLSDTSAKFVKNLAIAVFGTTTLKESSVTGVVSNRVKNKHLNAIARPKLDATKLLAIKGALAFWLRTEKNVDEVSIDIEVTRVGSHISHKIFELLRKDKKNDDYLHANGPPELVISGNGDDARDQQSNHSDGRNIASFDSERSNDEEKLDAGQKSNDSTSPDNEEISAEESDTEIEGIIREDHEKPENSRDEENGANNSNITNGEEDDTHSQHSEE